MDLQEQIKTIEVGDQKLNDLIIDAIEDVKGKKIAKVDLRHLDDAPTDYFIICEGDSTVQVRAIADNVVKRLKEDLGLTPSHLEGQSGTKWVLVDYFSTVVHVFYPETRAFYELEELWSDAKITHFESL